MLDSDSWVSRVEPNLKLCYVSRKVAANEDRSNTGSFVLPTCYRSEDFC